jgi:hypothetical protein
MTGTAGASNPQVRSPIRTSPQVARSAPRTLSRWRHGFEPRWDYQGKRIVGTLLFTLVKGRRGPSGHTKGQVKHAKQAGCPSLVPRHGAESMIAFKSGADAELPQASQVVEPPPAAKTLELVRVAIFVAQN